MKPSLCLLVFLVIACALKLRRRSGKALRVFNGRNDTEGKYPYVIIVLGWGRQRIGSGALLTPHWVLTAAHCCLREYGADFINYGNIAELAIVGETCSQIVIKIMHPRFDARLALTTKVSLENDIGLMNVHPEVPMPRYGKLSAVDYKTLIGVGVEYAGFGISDIMETTWDPNVVDHRPLQIGNGVIRSCAQVWKIHTTYKGYICVSPKCSKLQVPMVGDSGGPLFYDDKIVAVLSQGEPDQFENYWTPVSRYLTWIHHEITSRG